jgi:type II secretory pathway predicted ATPase ExeA
MPTPWDPNAIVTAASTARVGTGTAGPVLHGTRSTALTYEAFYGLKEKPFSLSSDSRFFYQSRSHAPAFEDLLAGIRRRESLCALTGDIGTGKTTLCRAVLQNLDRKTFSAFVPDPFASREDLLKVLLMDFGVLSVDDLTSGRLKGASRTELSYLLYEFLDTLTPLQAFAVVIIDEAQNLSVPLLEEIRILSDSDGRERQLQVVLVGQLELGQKLKLPEMRQVDQRLSVHATLEPLGSDGVAGYVAHRLQVAGGSPDRVRLSADAVEAVYRLSGGVPRLINRICDRALYQGYLRRANEIDVEIVRAAMPGEDVPVATPPPVAAMPPLRSDVLAVPDFQLPGDPDPVDHWLIEGEKALGPKSTLLPGDPLPGERVPAVMMLAAQMLADQRAADEMTAERLAAAHIAAERDRLRPSPSVVEVARPAVSSRPPAPVATARKQMPTAHREFVPTHMQKTTSKLGRGLGILTLWLMGLTGAGLGGATVWTVLTDLTAPVELPAPPPERPLLMPRALEAPLYSENLLLDVPAAGDRNGTRIATPR